MWAVAISENEGYIPSKHQSTSSTLPSHFNARGHTTVNVLLQGRAGAISFHELPIAINPKTSSSLLWLPLCHRMKMPTFFWPNFFCFFLPFFWIFLFGIKILFFFGYTINLEFCDISNHSRSHLSTPLL